MVVVEAVSCIVAIFLGSLYMKHRKATYDNAQQRREEQRLRHEQWQHEEQRRREERWRHEERVERERREQKRIEKALSDVDLFIRTRRRFNTSHPLEYSCMLNTIESEFDADVCSLLKLHGDRFCFSADGKSIKVRHLTPFQGAHTQRVFGEFRCSKCGRRWESAGSWKNKWQACQSCEERVYPYSQRELEHRIADADADGELVRRPHDMARCERCRERGELCMPRFYYAS